MSSPLNRVNYGQAATPTYAPSTTQSGATPQSVSGLTLSSVALVGGLHANLSYDEIKELQHFSINKGIQQAMLNGIASAPDGLSVRPIIPDIDFLDANGNAVGKREWVQPWSGTFTNVSAAATPLTIYQTGNSTRYDRKVLVFWGITLVNVGNQRTAGVIDTSSIVFSDTAGTTYDIWDPQRLDTVNALYAHAPIIYPNSRTAKIGFLPKYGASGAFEIIQLIGRVIEPFGDTIQGARGVYI